MPKVRPALSAFLCAFSLLFVAPRGVMAQDATRGRLTLTVKDPSGGGIPGATVTLTGLDPETRATPVPPTLTSDRGVATFPTLVLGRYSARVTFAGFDPGVLREFRIQRGDNTQSVALSLSRVSDSITVGEDGPAAAADRGSRAFGTTVSAAQLQALSEDSAELARQIADLAGPDAIIRVDSFEGQQLPPKSQIKSIHVTRDQFAAETEQPGSTFVDVITQPGVGALRGQANFSFRDGSMSAKSQFTPTKGPERLRNYGVTVSGALVKEKAGFSLNIGGQNNYSTPNLNVALPTGKSFDVLALRQPLKTFSVSGTLDYALTRDQTLKFGYSQNNAEQSNLGIGAYDLPERAWAATNNQYTFRVLEAGPLGRRTFINSRLSVGWRNSGNTSSVELPTIVVQDAFTSGGAQRAGRVENKNFNFASDIDYVVGRNSWRVGLQSYGDWYTASLNNNYLGTYFFSSPEAFQAGTPLLYTRSLGDPLLSFFHARIGAYIQDDIRVRQGLTLSPGVRYSYQTRVNDKLAFEPRFGITWSPKQNGNTTLRASWGIFHGWLDPGIWWQTVRSDGTHQRDIIISNPSYPDPGTGQAVRPANTYVLGDYQLNQNYRYSAGIDHRFSPRLGFNLLYNYYNQSQLPRGTNLNPVVNGVRADPSLGNVISTITDAQLRRHEFYANFNWALVAPSPAVNAARFNWRRLTMNGSYAYTRARRNALGPFDVPPSGSIDDEWGRGPADNPYRTTLAVTSTQIRNLTVNVSANAADGTPYMLMTGFDDNHDGVLNDRPAGVGILSLRGDPTWTVTTRFTYNLPMGAATAGQPARYRTSLYLNISNLTNHANYAGFSGVMTSPFFRQPTAVSNPRKMDVGLTVAF